jgi:hypothetical protein
MVLGPYFGPFVDSPQLLELAGSCLASLGCSLEQGGQASRIGGMEK